jgi:hypothetical protein
MLILANKKPLRAVIWLAVNNLNNVEHKQKLIWLEQFLNGNKKAEI